MRLEPLNGKFNNLTNSGTLPAAARTSPPLREESFHNDFTNPTEKYNSQVSRNLPPSIDAANRQLAESGCPTLITGPTKRVGRWTPHKSWRERVVRIRLYICVASNHNISSRFLRFCSQLPPPHCDFFHISVLFKSGMHAELMRHFQ